ncbi:MAG TPA: hypothetical protein VGG31_09955 [Candidatus Dormibacteraeota bacterium]
MSDFLVRLSIRSAMFAGAIAGFVFGLFFGAALGALASWFAGSILDWQAQLGFSLGVTQQLIPLGDQAGSLQSISDHWYLVIPAVAVAAGLVGAFIGVLAGGLWAALVNLGVLPIEVAIFDRRESHMPAPKRVGQGRKRLGKRRRTDQVDPG